MDIKTHKNENNQLLSIKGVDYDYQSKQFILKLLNKLIQFAGNVLIQLRRNNYEDSSIDKLKKEGVSLGVKSLKVDSNLFEISFNFNAAKSKEELLPLIVDLWYCFQQPVYYFFTNEERLEYNNEILLNNNLSWKEVVDLSNSYVMFKGAEEDVIWIGKSDELEFDLE
ncbi:hypothetical protein GCM10007049_16460 [Echinicola pacifica]|uniref:Uncharacterized protein n=1 Tax=Echinicola pacifica TaxID=346377 RepID=A0A918UPC6_9BACT|nr:hypothetical protein [Echinicola pacifica]GGZ24767.1 hypothetical protein GCM10007049_16460 [Echinicola pacifica]